MEKNNVNLINFATEMSEITGQKITMDHVHCSPTGRNYYIQPPKAGAPMLLHHYRGPFFVDIHPDDYENIAAGNVAPHDYIASAKWQVGYYWGGGSMIGGGYYQPLDIVGRSEEVQKYLKSLYCRSLSLDRYFGIPTCESCKAQECIKRQTSITEEDPRRTLFRYLAKRFKTENPGYTLRGFLCGDIPENEIWLTPNGKYDKCEPFSFTAYASYSVIRSLLMHEIEPKDWTEKDWTEYVKNNFEFRIHEMFGATYEISQTTLEKAFEGKDYTKKTEAEKQTEDQTEDQTEKQHFLKNFLNKLFKK